VATEVAQNIAAHAGRGEVFLRATSGDGVELLAVDKGPGMSDIGACLRDGFSTAGTQGMGLGMLTRTADRFDLYSQPGRGTVASLEVMSSEATPMQRPALTFGVVCAPCRGETDIGDSWSVDGQQGRWRALVVDGLGHGTLAKAAADIAVKVFDENADEPPVEVMHRMHSALRKSRGAAAAILSFDPSRSEASFVGVGNISATLLNGEQTRSMVAMNGTLGVEVRRVLEFSYPCPAETLIVMASDGLVTHWKLDGYPGLLQRHPSIIAAILYRDFSRQRDDVTVLCARREVLS